MTNEIQRCYRTLEIEPGTSLERVKQAYRELAKVWHPDRFPNDPKLQHKAQEKLKEINDAYKKLQEFISENSSTPPRDTTSRTQSSDGPASGDFRGATPPPKSPASNSQPAAGDRISNRGWQKVILGFTGVGLLVLLVAVLSDPEPPANPLPVVPGFLAGSWQPAVLQPTITPPPVSLALDEKNGFKEFKFGMTPAEARAISPPTSTGQEPGAKSEHFIYKGSVVNDVGDSTTDSVTLRFFDGHLFRIDLRFSRMPDAMFEAMKINFGEPYDSIDWTRGNQTLRAKSWRGEKVAASILALPGQAWDSAVIYEMESDQAAKEYAAKEPERAANSFGTNGFKSLAFGSKPQETGFSFEVLEEDAATAVKKVLFRKGDLYAIGYYPLERVTGEFFKDQLYRIDLRFEENDKEIFRAFAHRFGSLQGDQSWTRGAIRLQAESGGDERISASILCPETPTGDSQWDTIVVFDSGIRREAEQYKQDAPKRAAKDF